MPPLLPCLRRSLLALLIPVAVPVLGAGLVFNEVMYHPPGDDDSLQFIELHNPGPEPVNVEGWKISKGVKFTAPAASIPPGGFLVLCRKTTAFQRQFGTNVPILGEFAGKMKHGGERLELVNREGKVVDSFKFDDAAPWPTGPDGSGCSLERITPAAASDDPHNWASALPADRQSLAATPGRTNSTFSPQPPPIIEGVRFTPPRPNVPTRVSARVQSTNRIRQVELRYQVLGNEPVREESVVLMKAAGTSDDYTGEVPPSPPGRLLRFRIRAVNENGTTRLEPGAGEPRPTFSGYLLENTNRLTIPEAFLVPFGPRESEGSSLRHRPRTTKPEVSRGQSAFIYLPTNGAPIRTFDHIRLTPRAGGWKVRLHKEQPLDDMTTLNLVYEHEPRWVLSEPLSYELFRRTGVPAPKTGHLRLWMQGRPLGYHLMVEQANGSFLRRQGRDPDGNLYKLLWYGRDVVGQHEKKNNPESGHADLLEVIQGLNRETGTAQWEFIQREFHVEELANYFAASMCVENWDGFFNNYFAYHSPGAGGRWEMIPWDQDKTWGDYDGASPDYDWYEMPLTYGMKGDREPGGRLNLFRSRNSMWGSTAWWRPGGYFSGPLLANPEFRKVFLKRLRVVCTTVFTEKEFLPVINDLERRLEPEVRYRAQLDGVDPGEAVSGFKSLMESFRRQLRNRRAFLLKELDQLPESR